MIGPTARRSLGVLGAGIALAFAVVGCVASVGATAAPASAPPGGAVLVARDIAFDRSSITVAAGSGVPLLFENRDAAPHNVTVVTGDGTVVFAGETFGGPDSRIYNLPALAAGTYGFRCDVHPHMTGTLVAAQPT